MTKNLELSTKALITETVRIVRTECPIAYVVFNRNFEFDKKCKDCDWCIEDIKCGWYIYKTNIVKEHVIHDEDDGTGAMPFDDYYKYIKCYNSGSEIKHHSGYSWFTFGDIIKCKECNTTYMYLGSGDDGLKFGIPYKQYIAKDDKKDEKDEK